MNRLLIALAVSMLCVPLIVTAQDELPSETDQISYVLGMEIGGSLKQLEAELNLDALLKGMKTVLHDEPLLLSAEQAEQVKQVFFAKVQQRQQQQAAKKSQGNAEEGKKFLAENKTREGVVETASGLQYEVVKQGEGANPKATDTVSVHYRGTLLDGTEFDSSYRRGQPATFALNQVIPGWTEGVQLMKAGSTYRFFVPSKLAYGERGAGAQIGPHATLIFDVELLEVK